jgi:hypothetical protein
MTASDSSWLKFWEALATSGFLLVLVGVIFEGVEHFIRFPKRQISRKRRIEKNAWFVLVVGLAMELLGDNRAKRITDADNVRLNGLASIANERAANTESNNLVLRAKVATLEIAALRRTFTSEQISSAHIFLDKYANTPFILESFTDPDSTRFGEDLFDLLKKVGWEVGGIVNGADERIQKAGLDIPRTQEPVGVKIEINDNKYNDAANALNSFLNGCKIKSEIFVNLHPQFIMGGNGVHVRVGTLQ